MSVTRTIISVALLCCIFVCDGRRVNSLRGKLRAKESLTIPVAANDTVTAGLSDISVVGYEKAQNSMSESFFVVNRSGYHIKGINLSIEYLNLRQEQLHINTLTIDCDIPPGQTRSLQLKSWDRQHLWYYTGTQGKHNEYCNPFDVRIRINYLITEPDR